MIILMSFIGCNSNKESKIEQGNSLPYPSPRIDSFDQNFDKTLMNNKFSLLKEKNPEFFLFA